MLKLATHTKILFVQEDTADTKYRYLGWNNVGSLAYVLNARLKDHRPSLSASKRHLEVQNLLHLIREKGFLTPVEAMDRDHLESYWIVEKAIPFDVRESVKNDEIPVEEIIKQLKV